MAFSARPTSRRVRSQEECELAIEPDPRVRIVEHLAEFAVGVQRGLAAQPYVLADADLDHVLGAVPLKQRDLDPQDQRGIVAPDSRR